MSRNSNQLSVAELLARNGQQPTSGRGGRRRREGRGVPVSELSGDIPVVGGGGSHAAPDGEEPAAGPAEYDPAGDGYASDDYADERVSGGEPSQSPMSGPITVYNPLAPDPGEGTPSEPGSYPSAEEVAPRRGGRRRRPEPDDDPPLDGYSGAPPATEQPWESGPPPPPGSRAARRRAAEAAEAEQPAAPAADTPLDYRLPPTGAGSGPFPAPAPAAPRDTGFPGPSWPAPESGSPPAAPPTPPTEFWQAPAPGDDPRPKLERRRRGARPIPEPAPRPEPPQPSDEAGNADQATAVWSLAEPQQRGPAGPMDPPGPHLEKPGRPPRGGNRFGPPGGPVPVGPPGPGAPMGPPFPDSGPPPNADMFATDVYEPMAPAPEPGEDTGTFDPDSDFYAPAEDEADEEPRKGRRFARSGGLGAATAKFGGATEKFAAVRTRLAAGGRADEDADAGDPRKQWLVLGGQSVGAALAGMLLFKGFELLWGVQPLAALALAVVVILGLVALVRILRRTDDIFSTVIAVVVGVFVTLGPLAFLLSTG